MFNLDNVKQIAYRMLVLLSNQVLPIPRYIVSINETQLQARPCLFTGSIVGIIYLLYLLVCYVALIIYLIDSNLIIITFIAFYFADAFIQSDLIKGLDLIFEKHCDY